MNAKNLFLVLLLALSLASGCSSGDKSGAGDSASAASAEKATCDGCNKEVAKATLVSHDGQMLCKDCMAEHDH
jgi:hypothetical protein